MSSGKFILEGKIARPENNLRKWAKWFEDSGEERVVAKTHFANCMVSTVFLGLDHNFGEGPPKIFETLVFNGEFDGEMDRYSTWEQAEAGHETMGKRVGIKGLLSGNAVKEAK